MAKYVKEIKKNPKKFAESQDQDDLAKILKSLSSVYYNTGKSLVTDEEYDIMRDVLEERDPESKYLQEVGAVVEKNQAKLPYPMGSLNKIKPERQNLASWLQNYPGPYILSDKLDGVSGQFYKDDQGVAHLYTRGDGLVGSDITHLVKYVLGDVDIDAIPSGTSVRGELLISRADFGKISGKLKNARNAVAGLVNSKTIDKKVANLCQFVAYAILHPQYPQSKQMELLTKYGFRTATYKTTKKLDYDMLGKYLVERRAASDFEIDGIVVVDDSKIYPVESGNPPYAFAFKTLLQDQIAVATIKKIHWNASMDGYLKPTIEISPIDLGGVTITYATAFNAKYIVDNNLGPGAEIKIVRSGDVIPHILEVTKPAKTPQMPQVFYKWNKTGVDIVLQDTHGAQADAVTIKLLVNFFQKLGIDSVGEGIVTKLVHAGYKTIPDVIDAFQNSQDDLATIEGIGPKLVQKIWKNIENAFADADLATLMVASHIFGRGFGEKKIREILAKYPDIMREKWSKKIMKENIEKLHGFSETTAHQFAIHFEEFKKLFSEINDIIDISHLEEPDEAESVDNDLDGKTFVFTGFRDKDLRAKVEGRGGKVSESISSKTTALVRADGEVEKSGKILDAEKKKIPVITRSEFVRDYDLD